MFEINENAFYTLPELKDYLKIAIPSIRAWIRKGKLRASKIGRNYIVSGRDLAEFLRNGYDTRKKEKDM
jgi:excisionase family DNA binding protein